MGERTSYPPGTFSWAELATSDAEGAKAFYTALFGWDYEDSPVGDGQVYSMARREGGYVAALYRADQPPHWNCYVTVASVENTTAKAREHDATVVAEPFDVMDVGRMSVITDPAGAALCLWEPRKHIGAGRVNTPGAMTWNDLITPDPDAAAGFYGALFGWTTEEIPGAGGYRVIKNGERSNGGIMPAPDGAPPVWMPYFGHEDVEDVAGEADGLGATVLNGPLSLIGGRIAVLADPQGAMFAVWTGFYDD
jgi:hypothetical protein